MIPSLDTVCMNEKSAYYSFTNNKWFYIIQNSVTNRFLIKTQLFLEYDVMFDGIVRSVPQPFPMEACSPTDMIRLPAVLLISSPYLPS